MKKMLSGIISLLFAAILMAAVPTDADAEIYDDTLRLHILAASDSAEDQDLKIAVRDAILLEYGERLSSYSGLESALEAVEALLPEIERCARECIRAQGFDYSVTAELTVEEYDTRDYGELSLPRGRYNSLVVKIGEGEGRNWWCVMYPPMCLDMALDAPSDDWVSGYTDTELSLITGGKYRVKFKLLELVSDFYGQGA